MALPALNDDPACMFRSNVSRNDRLSAHRFRVPVAVTGAAVLGLSLLMSVGPALGANNHSNGNGPNGNVTTGGGNGTSGNMKVHDAATGLETSGNDNEPHVCDFWLGFTLDAPFEAGTWVVVSWAPTGDGSTVAFGVYDTSGDGIDSSSVLELPAGHYRAAWTATGATASSKKTFWVDADCDETVTPVDEPPAEEVASPSEESEAEDPASPVEEPALLVEESPTEESPTEEAVAGEEESLVDEESPADEAESPAEEPALVDEESPAEESVLEGDGSATGDQGTLSDESPDQDSNVLPEDPGTPSDGSPAGEPGSQVEEPVTEDPGTPSDESPATSGDLPDEEDPALVADPGSTDAAASPAQDPLEGDAESGEATMSDTAAAMFPVQSGLAATLGVLLLIVVHAITRRGKRSDIHA